MVAAGWGVCGCFSSMQSRALSIFEHSDRRQQLRLLVEKRQQIFICTDRILVT